MDAIFNNWLGDKSDQKKPPERPKIAWLETSEATSYDGGLTQQTRDELERIREQKDQSPFTQFLTEINSRINQNVLQQESSAQGRDEPPPHAARAPYMKMPQLPSTAKATCWLEEFSAKKENRQEQLGGEGYMEHQVASGYTKQDLTKAKSQLRLLKQKLLDKSLVNKSMQ